jgi:hypothetical protein
MHTSRASNLPLLWLTVALLLAGCSSGGQPAGMLSTPAPSHTPASPTRTPTHVPTATQEPVPLPVELVILHTNDNWGATEPCG